MPSEDIAAAPLIFVLPSVCLIIPFLIVFMIRKVRWFLLNSIGLFIICILLEYAWWRFLLADHGKYGLLFAITNPFVIITVIIYIELLKVKSQLKTSLIFAFCCGFFHIIGIYAAFARSESHTLDLHHPMTYVCLVPNVVIIGAIGGVIYCIVNLILHYPWRIYREAKKEYSGEEDNSV